MEDNKREVLDMHGSNLSKLDVSKAENLVELYAQDNLIETIDLSNNKKLEAVDCTGNPLIYIRALAPGCEGRFPLELEAANGGFVGLKIEPGLQQYEAVPAENYEFDGWYDELGDRLSREAVWQDTYGASRLIIANFRKK